MVVLISTLAVPKWMREKIINGVELLIAFEAHFVFFVSLHDFRISYQNIDYSHVDSYSAWVSQ